MPCRNLCERIAVRRTNGSLYDKGYKYCRRCGVFCIQTIIIMTMNFTVLAVEGDCGLVQVTIVARIENAVLRATEE